ncbi:hypothetical protein K1719_016322 [Acacia pycnantha]|nr:hypothetical protein K1719_016322 [Acacia pycnantha]
MAEIQISTPLIWKEATIERILVGKVLANKTFTRSAMEAILSKAWNLQEGIDVVEINDNAFLFKFEDENEYNRILRGRPWSINSHLLNLMERSKYKSYEEFDFSLCPVWIQMHNVPIEAMCLENTIRIGEHVGKVMLAEDPFYNGRFLRSFLRARIILDLKRPLAHGFWMPTPEKKKVWISILYEKLQCFCYNCGRIGHDNRICKSEKLMSTLDPSMPRFGNWLTTNQCRNWDEVMAVVCKDWVEADYVRKRQEEASIRRANAEKSKNENEKKVDETELFFIRMNKATMRSTEAASNVYMGTPDAMGENTCSDGEICLEVKNRRKVQHQSNLHDNIDRGEERRCSVCQANVGEPSSKAEVSSVNHIAFDAGVSTNQTTDALIENDMAIVLYNGGVLGEITNGMKGLGLKRNAEDRWGSSLSKRRKKMDEELSPKLTISAYAENLRKSKARIRRNIVKKRKGDKENILEEETNLEDENMAIADEGSGDSGFIFKARRDRRKKISTEGSDHHALVVYCYYQERKGTRPFKFEANWVHHDNFLQIVENGWNEVEGTVDDRVAYLVRRLMACKQKLIAWSSKEFPNYRKVIAHLRHMLSSLP